MKVVYTSDLHGQDHLYQELLNLTKIYLAQSVVLGGDLLPSYLPTKRIEDMIPRQKNFIDQFLVPFFITMLESTKVEKIFLISGNWDLTYRYIFRKPIERVIDLDQKLYTLANGYDLIGYPFVPPTPFWPKGHEKMDDSDAPWPPQKNPSYICSMDQDYRLIPIDPHRYLR